MKQQFCRLLTDVFSLSSFMSINTCSISYLVIYFIVYVNCTSVNISLFLDVETQIASSKV